MQCMDRLDRKILSVLQANARASLQEIGQAVGLSPSPCWGRIKKMEEAGVIEGYTVRLNARALDLSDTVLVMVTLDSHSDNTLEKFGETLASIPEVIEAHLVSGDYDYLPERMSAEETLAAVKAIVAELGAAGPGDMGKVMGVVKTRLAGKADMGQVSAAVKAALAG